MRSYALNADKYSYVLREERTRRRRISDVYNTLVSLQFRVFGCYTCHFEGTRTPRRQSDERAAGASHTRVAGSGISEGTVVLIASRGEGGECGGGERRSRVGGGCGGEGRGISRWRRRSRSCRC